MEDVRQRLKEIEDKRLRLTDAGLLDSEFEPYFELSSIDDTKAEVLSLYIEDVEKKLAVFDKLLSLIHI